jgi:hypothetical protein
MRLLQGTVHNLVKVKKKTKDENILHEQTNSRLFKNLCCMHLPQACAPASTTKADVISEAITATQIERHAVGNH